ncbi:MAG: hypothetical protein ACREEM_03295 [Blastocatellia bacterium]
MKQTFIAALALVCLSGQEKPVTYYFTSSEVERAFEQIPAKPPTNKNIISASTIITGKSWRCRWPRKRASN